jgi:hypothetical protein
MHKSLDVSTVLIELSDNLHDGCVTNLLRGVMRCASD